MKRFLLALLAVTGLVWVGSAWVGHAGGPSFVAATATTQPNSTIPIWD